MDCSMIFEEHKILYNLYSKINGFIGTLNYARFELFGESHSRVPFIHRVFSTKNRWLLSLCVIRPRRQSLIRIFFFFACQVSWSCWIELFLRCFVAPLVLATFEEHSLTCGNTSFSNVLDMLINGIAFISPHGWEMWSYVLVFVRSTYSCLNHLPIWPFSSFILLYNYIAV